MKICLTLKIIICGLFCVFPDDIKGQACKKCKKLNGECKSCDVGCYLVSNYWCHKCRPECYSCSSPNNCDVCKAGLYGLRCNYDCVSCGDGSCTNNTCTDGCADGYYHHEEYGGCERCPNTCVTCNSIYDCTSCIAGRTGSFCQNCKPGHYLKYGQCNQCNTNCLHATCFANGGECIAGCKDGWTGWECNDTCGPNCALCDRHNETACTACKPGHYGPSCSNVCRRLSGECPFECSRLLCFQDGETKESDNIGGTQDTKKSVDISVIIGSSVGSAVLIIVVVAAVLGSIFFRKRRWNCVFMFGRRVGAAVLIIVVVAALLGSKFYRKRRREMFEYGGRYAFDNYVNVEDGNSNGNRDGNTNDNVYSLADMTMDAHGSGDKTVPAAHNTLPILTQPNGAAEIEDVLHGNMGGVPVIPFVLDVDEVEDNNEEICDGDVGDADAPNVENYYNINGLTGSRVEVGNLRDHVASISSDDIEKEFKKLPEGLTCPYGDAVNPTNVLKNRYKGIYPYNSTRVILTGNRGDYINASYIQGFDKSEKTYIASTGAGSFSNVFRTTMVLGLSSHIYVDNRIIDVKYVDFRVKSPTKAFMKGYVDFWQMVWQEKVDKIVMLTNFMEESKMKCEKYWPDVGEHKTYGDIIVHCMSAERYADFTVTKLSMKKDSQVASIHHFHFTEWPYQGTPENVISLVEFRESVEHVPKITEGPIVVHCSAGVGRTGTYIALDILTREGQSENYVDVYGCVLALRGQRVFMVQTLKQYQFLHDSLSHSLTNKCDQIASENICTVKTDEIQKQFQLLGTVNVHNSNEERSEPGNCGDAHIPRLLEYNQNPKSDHINAIYVDGYKEKNRYIIAQTPLSRTVKDFFGLVIQENCSCIISLDPVGISRKQDIVKYLPGVNKALYVGKVKISCTQRKTTPDYILSKLNVCLQAESTGEPKQILHYQYTEWPEASPVPLSTGSFLNLVLDSRRSVPEPNMPIEPVIIHCLAGSDRCGLFPVVSNILEKINSEQQASIVNVVSQVRTRRPCAIPNQEQFKYCYELASLFVEKSVYSNFFTTS